MMYDSLNEADRLCVWCKADCWPEPENQSHSTHCPFATGVYPADEGDECSVCLEALDFYILVDDDGQQLIRLNVGSAWRVCLGCGIQGRKP
jgi:hypothetical protein